VLHQCLNKVKKFLYFITLFLLTSFPAISKNNTDQLNELFLKLETEQNIIIASKIESKIWELWTTHPSEPILTELLSEGSYYMSQNQLANAHEMFSKAIELDPNWAEAWNKRATVLYLMGKYELSQNDIDKVLSLEERHFGALSGQGLVQSALKNYQLAIDSYIEAHKIYPAMESPMIMIERLKKLIKNETV
jgi:tetratricopeptide (TPR) repeat protein